MPVIEVKMWKGRTEDQKRELIRKLTDATVETIECPHDAVQVIINEYDLKNWGLAGKPASDEFGKLT